MKITEKLLKEWRDGLHAGNPWECKALVAMIDAERAKGISVKESMDEESRIIDAMILKFTGQNFDGTLSERLLKAFECLTKD